MSTMNATTVLVITDCCVCGVEFALPKVKLDSCLELGGTMFCPNGHTLSYRKTELQRAKEERDQALKLAMLRRDEFFAEQRAHEATKRAQQSAEKETKRIKRRVKNGVCPCCQRTVSQMARHMKTKHPDYEGKK